MVKKIVVFLLIFTTGLVSAQKIFVISKNSQFFVVTDTTESATVSRNIGVGKLSVDVNKRAYKYLLNIYQVKNKQWVQQFILETEDKLKSLDISANGLLVVANTEKMKYVFNIFEPLPVKKYQAGTRIILSNHSGIYALLYPRGGEFINGYTGRGIQEFKSGSAENIDSILFTDDDNYLIIRNKNRLQFSLVKKKYSVKFIDGSDFRINLPDSIVTTFVAKGNQVRVTKYRLPQLKKIGGTVVKLTNLGFDKTQISEIELKTEMCSFSPEGTRAALYIIRGNKESHLIFYDLTEQRILADFNSLDYKAYFRLNEHRWISEESVVFPVSEVSSQIYNVTDKQFLGNLYSDFNPLPGIGQMPVYKQVKNRVTSPDQQFVALNVKNGRDNTLFFKSATVQEEVSFAPQASLFGFSQSGKYIFAMRGTSQFGYFLTSDIAADLHTGNPLPFYAFSDSLSAPKNEDFIANDSEKTGTHKPIQQFLDIAKASDSVRISLQLKTIQMSDSLIGIQVHLIDKNQNYYYGGSNPQWRYVWSNIVLNSPDGNVKRVDTFNIEETVAADSVPVAIAIVMDHSGSMGDSRATKIQEGALKFIEQKRPKDGVVVIKYDQRIGIDAEFSTDKKTLINSVTRKGLKGYGGSTSLLDAIDRAVSILETLEQYKRKSIIVLTDGNENSSILTKGQVLKHANSGITSVYTVGFGDYVSDDYLNAIAQYTQGSFYHIYRTPDFDWIFKDIYNRMMYYYTLKFKVDTVGEFNTYLEVTFENDSRDSLVANFNNSPINYEKIDDMEDLSFKAPVKKITTKQLNPVIQKQMLKVIDSSQIQYRQVREIAKLKQKQIRDSIAVMEQTKKMETDFKTVKLPNVEFFYNETRIIPGSENGIENVVDFLNRYKDVVLELRGHTDSIGEPAVLQKLSLDRANAIKKLLTEHGVSESRITVSGFGATRPIAPNNTDEGRQKNRRVEFIPSLKKNKIR